MADFDGSLLDYETKGNRVSLAGIDKINESVTAYRLDVVTSLGDYSSILINTTDYLIYAVDEEKTDQDKKVIYHTVFGQYSIVNGIRFAHEFITTINPPSTPISTLSISRVEVNNKLNDSLFGIPGDKEKAQFTILSPIVLSSSNRSFPVRKTQVVIPRLHSIGNFQSGLQGRIAFLNAIKPLLKRIEAWVEGKDGTRLILLVGTCADGKSIAEQVVNESREDLQKVGFLELVVGCENGSRYTALVR